MSLGHVRPTSSSVSETVKDSTSARQQTIRFAASLIFLQFPPVWPAHRHFRKKFLVWILLHPDNLDVRFTDDASLPSCLPNMPKQFSESVGSVCASEHVVISESHDVKDMQLQVAQDGQSSFAVRMGTDGGSS